MEKIQQFKIVGARNNAFILLSTVTVCSKPKTIAISPKEDTRQVRVPRIWDAKELAEWAPPRALAEKRWHGAVLAMLREHER